MTYYSRILHLVEVLRYEKGTMREDIKVWVQNHLEQHRRALALSCLVGVFLILPFGVRKFCETPERDIRKRVEEEARRATSAAQIITSDSETPSASAILLSAVTTGWKQDQAGWFYLNAAGVYYARLADKTSDKVDSRSRQPILLSECCRYHGIR